LGIEVLTFEGPGGDDYMLYAAVDPLVLLAQPGDAEDGARTHMMRCDAMMMTE
jgi:hypothetical protein